MNKWNEVTKFHGHECPGLAIGYRLALDALKILKVDKSVDEELLAIIETDACGADAIQVLTGCTFGKGNFFFKDLGKHALTLISRDKNQGVRLGLKYGVLTGKNRNDKIDNIFSLSTEKLFTIKYYDSINDKPDKAVINESYQCINCKEAVMKTRTKNKTGNTLCITCSEN
ncbi:FmdE family protein [Natranaerobius trueperi]|uniref:Formylmethanofuran dehydrogenase n=1 Tax=Natranaerobius trueperi TaxID=759412 RepID=A0A226BWH7_9FIRM|nr:FmdE family protein [Natranaerobius trueperi]OWZ82654.1 formylmethanofuran dehydrogenase [Natranaerobius trueperi]